MLLAAYDEHPTLAPGSIVRHGLRRSEIQAVAPRSFPDAAAFKAATQSAKNYPTLLLGAEWCLPLTGGPRIFEAPTPNGTEITMGRVESLLEELNALNQRTLRLNRDDMETARQAGPPQSGAPVEEVAPFGLSVLIALAEFADPQRVVWIMDY